ncbi:uncharacterized protein DUF5004 [Flavobacteriaceae bacterium MAR_2010_72]|nr:uncharacterized protein DUF5004 [Flavobacteriaceae bacterium MAR_2010_72]
MYKHINIMKTLVRSLCILSLFLISCDEDLTLNPDGFKEFTADIEGSWKIEKAEQNNIDITNHLDFGDFLLDLNYDSRVPSSFSFTGQNVPFITSASGSWTFDDLTYPTEIQFTDGGVSATAKFADPVLSNGKKIAIEFTLGCLSNVYKYTLMKQ